MFRTRTARRRPRLLGGKVYKPLAAGVLAFGLIAVSAGAASAATNYNFVSATARASHPTQVKVSFRIASDRGPVVNDPSAAYANSLTCDGCTTVAIAVTVDVVSGPVTTVNAPTNAVAYADNCTNCNTFASDFVFVDAPGTPASLTSAGRGALQSIGSQLTSDAYSNETALALQTQVNDLIGQIPGILANPADVAAVAPTGHNPGRHLYQWGGNSCKQS
jgi:hypothetical protein